MAPNLERLTAELVAEGESIKKTIGEAEVRMSELRNELETTRQYLRTVEEDRARRLIAVNEATGYAGQVANDIQHIRKVVDRLDGLVQEAVIKLRTIKLPKFLTGLGLGSFGAEEAPSTES